MTIAELMDYVDCVKPNAFSLREKIMWLNEVEGMVQTDVLLFAAPSLIAYCPDGSWEGSGVTFPDDATMVFPLPPGCHPGGTVTVTGFRDYAANALTEQRILAVSADGRLLKFAPGTFTQTGESGETAAVHLDFVGGSAELLVGAPYHKIYYAYLTAMIDFANGEYHKYQNAMALFNSFFDCFTRWYAQSFCPADGETVARGYYVSAYAIAVKNGFHGSETDFLTSLKGEKGETGLQGEQGAAFTYEDFTAAQLAALKGDKGERGEPGSKGAQGPQGEQGAAFTYEDFTAAQLTALKGDKGERGEPGPAGATGPQGEQGAPFLYTDFTAVQLAALKGEKGETGATGPMGPQGEQGAPFLYTDFTPAQLAALKGEQGEVGPVGPAGAAGPPGETGETGAEGRSAYTAAQLAGYPGTEAEFNADLAALDGLADWFAAL